MNTTIQNILTKRNIALILTGLLITISIFTFVLLLTRRGQTPNPSDTSPTPTLFPLGTIPTEKSFTQQESLPGRTTADEIQQNPDLIDTTPLPDGNKQYNISSINPFRPTEIITKDGVAIFEKTVIPTDANNDGTLTIATIQQKFGSPDRVIQGSAEYGPHTNTFSYSPQGFVFIANPVSGSIYEFHSFIPMTTDQYLREFGGEIATEDRDYL
jgi:hypothetical protein